MEWKQKVCSICSAFVSEKSRVRKCVLLLKVEIIKNLKRFENKIYKEHMTVVTRICSRVRLFKVISTFTNVRNRVYGIIADEL